MAGSFNPPHPGHLQCVADAAALLHERGRPPQALLVALKSDERLRLKEYGKDTELWLEFAQRRLLLQELLMELAHNGGAKLPELHFDDHWRHFRGDPAEIRRETDAYFGIRGVQVFRVMGEDQVQRLGLQADPCVLSVPRSSGGLSSTKVRRLLLQGNEAALEDLLPPKYCRLLWDLCGAAAAA